MEIASQLKLENLKKSKAKSTYQNDYNYLDLYLSRCKKQISMKILIQKMTL